MCYNIREDFGDDIMKCELSYKRGIEALKKNKIYLAEDIFKGLIKKNHNDLSARFALANLYLKIDEPYKARAIFSPVSYTHLTLPTKLVV